MNKKTIYFVFALGVCLIMIVSLISAGTVYIKNRHTIAKCCTPHVYYTNNMTTRVTKSVGQTTSVTRLGNRTTIYNTVTTGYRSPNNPSIVYFFDKNCKLYPISAM